MIKRGRGVSKQPWPPAEATTRIREKATDRSLTLCYTRHVKDRLEQRELLVSDLLDVLRNGFVYDEAEPATQEGFYKYSMEGTTPNSGKRRVRVIVIPYPNATLKIVTIMWATKNR